MDMDKEITREIVMLLTIILIVTLGIIFIFASKSATGQAILDRYSYTKAICNSTNFCQDYVIECESNETISITPITGAVLQNNENWQDPRNEKIADKFC